MESRETMRDTAPNPNVLLVPEAIDVFVARNKAGEIPDGNTCLPRVRGNGRVAQIVCAVRTTLERMGVDDPDQFDLVPYQNTLPGIARRLAEEDGHSNPRNKASDVALFFRAVLGVDNGRYADGPRPATSLEQVPVSWRPMFAPFVMDVVREPTECQDEPQDDPEPLRGNPAYRTSMMGFIDSMVINGVEGPEELPPDREGLLEYFAVAEVPEAKQSAYLTAYRHVVDLLGLPHPLYLPQSPFERGLRSLPNLRELCDDGISRRRNEEADWVPRPIAEFERWHVRDILACVAPEMSAELEEYLHWAEDNGGRSDGHNDRAMDAVASIVTELIRLELHEEAWQLNTLQLFLTVQMAQGMQATNARVRRRAAGNGIQPFSLARLALDAAARRSLANSVLEVHTTLTTAPVPYYTNAIRNQFFGLLAIVEYVHGSLLATRVADPMTWDRFEKDVATIKAVVALVNRTATTDGHKDVSLLPILWPQAVFVGLRDLRAEAKKAQADYWAAIAKHGSWESRAVRKAFVKYSDGIRLYIVAAFFLADGMRGRNYGYGRMNVNFAPEWELRDGKPHGITGVRVVFHGSDPIARPKKSKTTRRDGTQAVHKRSLHLNSALVDLDLVSDYVLEVRPRDLVRAGAIPDMSDYDPCTDQHAFIVNPKRPARQSGRRGRARGSNRSGASYSLPHLSKMFGFWLLKVARDTLKLTDTEGKPLPLASELKAETPAGKELRRRWRGLINGHMSRHLVSSYVGGWCKLWDIVRGMTDDTRETLEAVYTQNYAKYYESLRFESGVYHPDHFQEVTRAVFREPVLIDWDNLDAEHPEKSLVWIGVGSGARSP